MTLLERDSKSSVQRSRRLDRKSRLASGLVLLGLLGACAYEPLTDEEKAGLGIAGAGADSGDDTTGSGIGGSGDTSASGGSGSQTDGAQAATTSGSDSTSTGGAVGTTSDSTAGGLGSGGTVGTGGTTNSGGGPGSGGTTSAGGSAGSDATGGAGGCGGAGAGGTADSSGAGGVAGAGGTFQGATFRYVRLVATSSQNGKPFTAIAELELLDEVGQLIDNAGWTASADSEELLDESAPASQAIDGDSDTFWHTEWGSYEAPLPHYLQIDLGSAQQITGFIYTPRQDGLQNGRILDWEFYLSNSATDPGTAVDSGSFAQGMSAIMVTLP